MERNDELHRKTPVLVEGTHALTVSSIFLIAAVAVATLCAPQAATAYSVLAHEATIDALWDSAIVPVLRARFPAASREQLLEARGYAYGGCVIQDLGYYP